MLFNSLEFGLFLPLIFFIYWFILKKSLNKQNILLLVSSYIFYGWWDWRFLSLIAFSSIIDFLVGIRLSKELNEPKRKILLYLSIFVNLGMLVFFKYFNFFTESFSDAFTFFGYHIAPSRLNVILPVGISFYTFQTLSYTIDVYRRKIKSSSNFVSFFAFVSFFPQLVAGPIERASNLLPQFSRLRVFTYTKGIEGLRQILWGLFKKIVIADNCAGIVNEIFTNYQDQTSITLVIGAVFFALQIYGDFSGYSDIAIGTAKLFGFDLKKNFSFPYFSRDIAEFWRKWHISLSTWFRDYLYIPLGGSKGSNWNKIRNVFIIFIVSGMWHGANWTFLFWGLLNALYFLPLLLFSNNRKHIGEIEHVNKFSKIKTFFQIIFTFTLTSIAWIFFRSDTLTDSFSYLNHLFINPSFGPPIHISPIIIILIILFITLEWINRNYEHGLDFNPSKTNVILRYIIYYSIIASIFFLGGAQQDFIYFQF